MFVFLWNAFLNVHYCLDPVLFDACMLRVGFEDFLLYWSLVLMNYAPWHVAGFSRYLSRVCR
jgi:hypothetical protein